MSRMMQPYTPHGDSNVPGKPETVCRLRGCNLIPLTGTVTCCASSSALCLYTMQPYTPHGDSNLCVCYVPNFQPRDATLYPSRGQ